MNVIYWSRQSNSAIFRDITDVQVNFNKGAFKNRLQSDVKKQLLSYLPQVNDTLLQQLYRLKEKDWIDMNTWLNNPFNIQKLVEANEVLEVPKITYNLSLPDSINQQRADTLKLLAADFITRYRSTKLKYDFLCGKSEPVYPALMLPEIDNCSDSTFFAVSKGTELYKIYNDSLINSFDSKYTSKCLEAYKYESFTVTRPNSEYHYTLYYYDQAGNLVKTIPPAGVNEQKFRWFKEWSDSVKLARANHEFLVPNHGLATQYRYNTLNQVVAQQTPDAGKSQFWYDRLGRLVISQNAKQKAASGTEINRLYSYTEYDNLGRIKEVGEIRNASSNALHLRGSVILNWLKMHPKRQVQYMAGHKYISSTEKYASQEIDDLQDALSKHHPFG